uniref:Uncharacterized protein n=1 Tax=Cacopsylla melanoneura TaxID=428564 RepID=A0A8D9A2K5_9HEMI
MEFTRENSNWCRWMDTSTHGCYNRGQLPSNGSKHDTFLHRHSIPCSTCRGSSYANDAGITRRYTTHGVSKTSPKSTKCGKYNSIRSFRSLNISILDQNTEEKKNIYFHYLLLYACKNK